MPGDPESSRPRISWSWTGALKPTRPVPGKTETLASGSDFALPDITALAARGVSIHLDTSDRVEADVIVRGEKFKWYKLKERMSPRLESPSEKVELLLLSRSSEEEGFRISW